jgi:5'(3')-deoxyribonucleotidase
MIVNKKKIFIDMDGVLSDFNGGVKKLTRETYDEYKYRHDEIPGLFMGLDPIKGSKEAVTILKQHFELFILSTPSWGNSGSLTEKIN